MKKVQPLVQNSIWAGVFLLCPLSCLSTLYPPYFHLFCSLFLHHALSSLSISIPLLPSPPPFSIQLSLSVSLSSCHSLSDRPITQMNRPFQAVNKNNSSLTNMLGIYTVCSVFNGRVFTDWWEWGWWLGVLFAPWSRRSHSSARIFSAMLLSLTHLERFRMIYTQATCLVNHLQGAMSKSNGGCYMCIFHQGWRTEVSDTAEKLRYTSAHTHTNISIHHNAFDIGD